MPQIGLNSLADLTHEEFKQRYALGYQRIAPNAKKSGGNGNGFAHGALDSALLPPAVDWRAKGAVAEVKNQMSVSGSGYPPYM